MSVSSAENLVAYLTSEVLSVINVKTTVFWYGVLCKEEKKTLCLYHEHRLHYSFVYKIWAGQIVWNIEKSFEQYEKCG
jgi:hypothetical protein